MRHRKTGSRSTGSRPSDRPEPGQRLVFGKTGWALDFTGCEEEIRGIRQVMRGWGLRAGLPSRLNHQPRGHIVRTAAGWDWHEFGAAKARDWDAIPPRNVMRVITDVHDAAIYWYLADRPQLLCLHGAAARIGSGLVCFPASGRSGKSTLTACLAARGHKIFSDDVLGLESGRGLALGFLPRLRVPLPPALSKRTVAYIKAHQGPANESWIYLDPGLGRIAKLGETAPISAFVLLERLDHGPASIAPAKTADVLRLLIAENIIRQLPMTEIFDRLHALASGRSKFVLRYSDPQQAVRLLERQFQ